MKKLLFTLLLAFGLCTAAAAQAEWLTDFNKARDLAKKENKVLLLDFTGSDWCPPCIKLKNDVFSKKEFSEFAAGNLVLVEVDFPTKKRLSAAQTRANNQLKQRFGVESYPTIILLDSEGKKLGEISGYGGQPAPAYIKRLQDIIASGRK